MEDEDVYAHKDSVVQSFCRQRTCEEDAAVDFSVLNRMLRTYPDPGDVPVLDRVAWGDSLAG